METKDLFLEEYRRDITDIMKLALSELDFLRSEHDDVFKRLANNCPEISATIEQARFMSEDKMKVYRKKILDRGNDSIRKIENQMNRIHVEFIFKGKK